MTGRHKSSAYELCYHVKSKSQPLSSSASEPCNNQKIIKVEAKRGTKLPDYHKKIP